MESIQNFYHFHQKNTSLLARVKKRTSNHSSGYQRLWLLESIFCPRRQIVEGSTYLLGTRNPETDKRRKIIRVYYTKKIKRQRDVQKIRLDIRQRTINWLFKEETIQVKRVRIAQNVITVLIMNQLLL